MNLIYEISRFTEVHLLKRKSFATSELKSFCKLNPAVRKIRCDNLKEHIDAEFSYFETESCVFINSSPPHTPCINDISQRAKRSQLEKSWMMFFESNLPKNFWVLQSSLSHM